jgi:hypothetical protein
MRTLDGKMFSEMVEAVRVYNTHPVLLSRRLVSIAGSHHSVNVTPDMSVKDVVTNVGKVLQSLRMVLVPVSSWTQLLLDSAGVASDTNGTTENKGQVTRTTVVRDGKVRNRIIHRPSQKCECKSIRSRRPYLGFVIDLIQSGTYKQQEIIDAVLAQYPGLNPLTVRTFVTDLKNPAYSALKSCKVVQNHSGVMRFEKPHKCAAQAVN